MFTRGGGWVGGWVGRGVITSLTTVAHKGQFLVRCNR